MTRKLVISIDAMGGDNAPAAVIDGVAIAAKKNKNLTFRIYGDEENILPLLNKKSQLNGRCQIHHTTSVVKSTDKPSIAIRSGRKSSMWLAIESVKEKKADAIVSAGNTGALMAMSKIILRTLEDIERPAIVAVYPTVKGKPCVVLDSGANVDCTSEHLFQFAMMGDAFAKAITGLDAPKVGLLNIGSEDVKGNDTVKTAYQRLKEADLPINFHGFVEGNDICAGTVDVVVTDGFTGNIALKTAEGTLKMCVSLFKQSFAKTIFSKLGYLLAKRSLRYVNDVLNPDKYSGGIFLGLNGISVKSHGSSSKNAFANSINIAVELAEYDINKKIIEEIHSGEGEK